MKKLLLTCIIIAVFGQITVAQAHHGIKVDANFSSVKTDADYGTDIKSLLVPGIAYSFLYMGDNWGFLMDVGYSQSGFKEVYPTEPITTVKWKVHHIDLPNIGVQYAFLSDWSKIRPIIQGKIGFRLSLAGNISTADASEDFDYGVLDFPYSINGGVMINNHWTLTLGYERGLLSYVNGISGSRHTDVKLSATYYF